MLARTRLMHFTFSLDDIDFGLDLRETGKSLRAIADKTETFNAMGVTGTNQSFVLPVLYSGQDRKVATGDVVDDGSLCG